MFEYRKLFTDKWKFLLGLTGISLGYNGSTGTWNFSIDGSCGFTFQSGTTNGNTVVGTSFNFHPREGTILMLLGGVFLAHQVSAAGIIDIGILFFWLSIN